MAIDFWCLPFGGPSFCVSVTNSTSVSFDLWSEGLNIRMTFGSGLQEGGLQSTGFVIEEIYIDDWDMDAKERDDILGAIWERVEIYTREPHRREGTTFPLRNIRRAHLLIQALGLDLHHPSAGRPIRSGSRRHAQSTTKSSAPLTIVNSQITCKCIE